MAEKTLLLRHVGGGPDKLDEFEIGPLGAVFYPTVYDLLRRVFPANNIRPDLLYRMEAVFGAWRFDGKSQRLVATASAGRARDGAPALHWVATDPEFRRRGLSRRLCNLVLAWWWTRGEREVTVRLTPPTAEAKALYRSLDFEEVTNG